jgi:hypothetical protein
MISLADEYREFARECVAWARTSRSQQQRKQLLELARSWTAAATNLERALEGHRTAYQPHAGPPTDWTMDY